MRSIYIYIIYIYYIYIHDMNFCESEMTSLRQHFHSPKKFIFKFHNFSRFYGPLKALYKCTNLVISMPINFAAPDSTMASAGTALNTYFQSFFDSQWFSGIRWHSKVVIKNVSQNFRNHLQNYHPGNAFGINPYNVADHFQLSWPINSLAPGRSGFNFKNTNFNLVLLIAIMRS